MKLPKLDWSDWVPLEGAWVGATLPERPGIYRIRHKTAVLDYIGETGRNLRERVGALYGIYSDQIPFRDPHTAAPALWALRRLHGCVFWVSVAPFEAGGWMRKGVEAHELAQARRMQGASPAANFGRMPPGCSMSSYRKGNRRGCLTDELLREHLPTQPPLEVALSEPVTGSAWCGHSWTEWTPLEQLISDLGTSDFGLYRLRAPRKRKLAYIGQGRIRQRLRNHAKKGGLFADATLVSWVVGPWKRPQRLELETDLIGDHVRQWGEPPAAQFGGPD